MRQIFPAAAAAPEIGAGQDAVAALAGLYAYPPGPQPWLRANMVTSVDGAGWLDGRTSGLSGAADRLVFSVLRSLADVILVGSRTAIPSPTDRVPLHTAGAGTAAQDSRL